jgi:hypothetical protein
VIHAVMAEFQFEGAAAESEAAELVAEADAEDGHAAEELANVIDGVVNGLRVSGSVREEDAVGFHREDVFGGCFRGDDGDVAIVIDEQSQNVLLDAVIVGDDTMARGGGLGGNFRGSRGGPTTDAYGGASGVEIERAFVPLVGFRDGNAAGEFLAGHRGQSFRFLHQLLGGRVVGGYDAAQCADIAEVANESARVDVPDDGNAVAFEVRLGGFAGAPVGSERRKFADDQAFDVRLRRFFVVKIGADISNVRISEADNLAGIAGVGEYFLIAGEPGIKNNFSATARASAGRAAVKYASVFQRENRAPCALLRQCGLRKS